MLKGLDETRPDPEPLSVEGLEADLFDLVAEVGRRLSLMGVIKSWEQGPDHTEVVLDVTDRAPAAIVLEHGKAAGYYSGIDATRMSEVSMIRSGIGYKLEIHLLATKPKQEAPAEPAPAVDPADPPF